MPTADVPEVKISGGYHEDHPETLRCSPFSQRWHSGERPQKGRVCSSCPSFLLLGPGQRCAVRNLIFSVCVSVCVCDLLGGAHDQRTLVNAPPLLNNTVRDDFTTTVVMEKTVGL